VGRFNSIDPLTDINTHQTGFAYADNNPVSNIDFMGLDATAVVMKAYNQDQGSYDNQGNRKEGDPKEALKEAVGLSFEN